jgi:hypothetical protein
VRLQRILITPNTPHFYARETVLFLSDSGKKDEAMAIALGSFLTVVLMARNEAIKNHLRTAKFFCTFL